MSKFLNLPLVATVAIATMILGVSGRANAKVEDLGGGSLLLTGTISRSDIDALNEMIERRNGDVTTLKVSARGVGITAWEAVHEMSKALQSADIDVELIYAEDAAIAIEGRKTKTKGSLLAWNPIDIKRDTKIDVRIATWTRTGDTTTHTTRTVSESLAPTFDRFDFVCKGRIPAEATDIGSDPNHIVGRKDDQISGVRDATGHMWYYESTSGRGRWSHDAAQDVRRKVEQKRKTAAKRLASLRRAADRAAKRQKP